MFDFWNEKTPTTDITFHKEKWQKLTEKIFLQYISDIQYQDTRDC